MQPVPHQISGIRRISHCSMKPEINWRLSSSVSVKVMDFQDHVSYNFIIGMLYTQIFQELYYQADFNCGGRRPIHVTFMLDEFVNVALPDDFCSLKAVKYYEKLKDKGENVYIDSLTYEQFMMLGDAELSRRLSMQDEAEQKEEVKKHLLQEFRKQRF